MEQQKQSHVSSRAKVAAGSRQSHATDPALIRAPRPRAPRPRPSTAAPIAASTSEPVEPKASSARVARVETARAIDVQASARDLVRDSSGRSLGTPVRQSAVRAPLGTPTDVDSLDDPTTPEVPFHEQETMLAPEEVRPRPAKLVSSKTPVIPRHSARLGKPLAPRHGASRLRGDDSIATAKTEPLAKKALSTLLTPPRAKPIAARVPNVTASVEPATPVSSARSSFVSDAAVAPGWEIPDLDVAPAAPPPPAPHQLAGPRMTIGSKWSFPNLEVSESVIAAARQVSAPAIADDCRLSSHPFFTDYDESPRMSDEPGLEARDDIPELPFRTSSKIINLIGRGVRVALFSAIVFGGCVAGLNRTEMIRIDSHTHAYVKARAIDVGRQAVNVSKSVLSRATSVSSVKAKP